MKCSDCFMLLYDNLCDILSEYPQGCKGGRCDFYGRETINSIGGSTENPLNVVHRQKVSSQWSNTGDQTRRWYMVGERVRCDGLSREADVQTRKVSWLFLPATPRVTPGTVHETDGTPMQTLPVVDFTHGGRQLSMSLHAFL